MWKSEVIVEGDTFDVLEIPEYPSTGELGHAKIPKIGKLVGIPPFSNVTLAVEYADSSILTGYYIYPVQSPFYPDPDTFFYDEEYYNTNAFFPENLITISSPYLWQDCRIVEFPINPVHYNPVTGELKVYSNIRMRLDYWGTSNQNVQKITRDIITPKRARMYRDMIINFDFLGFLEREDVPAKYLIISDEYFASSINNLRFWKHKKGISTTVAYLDIDVNRNDIAIRNYIKEFFEYNHPLGYDIYVLLIGDPEEEDLHYLPMHIYTEPLIYSDHYYTCVYGEYEDDLYPDVQLGRISPAQKDEGDDAQIIEMIANRSIDYEIVPPISPWVNNYVIVTKIQDELKDDIVQLIESYPGVAIDRLIGNEGSTNADLKNEIEEGTSIINFHGHGLPQEWEEWDYYGDSWTVRHSINLDNYRKRPLIYSCACLTGQIQFEPICLGEAFMNASHGGAIGFYGYTYTMFTNALELHDKAMWEATFPPFQPCPRIYRTGDIQNYADARVLSSSVSNPELPVKKAIWLGCPELKVWTDMPKTLTVNHETAITPGVSFTVEVTHIGIPVENALVCIWKVDEDEIYEIQYTNINGKAFFTIPGTATRGEMYVTVTAHNYIPYEGVARIGIFSDDPLSLAYNGNRHLVREPNIENLHLVYLDEDKVWYRYSTNGGKTWGVREEIGDDGFPAIYLDTQNNPIVTWSYKRNDRLWFRRKDPVSGWGPIYTIYQRRFYFSPFVFHPVMTIKPAGTDPDTVHILARFHSKYNGAFYEIREIFFPIDNPADTQSITLDYSSGPGIANLDFPSIAIDNNRTLHAVWRHGKGPMSAIYYGYREFGEQVWKVDTEPFGQFGYQSDHPFIEIYGDSICVVWQHRSFMNPEEVYKGKRQIGPYDFALYNISNTPYTESVYPANASGLVSVFANEIAVPPPDSRHEIFWTTNGDIYNLSNTPQIRSTFPHTSLRITSINPVKPPTLYTVWLEGSNAPYEILSSRMYVPFGPSPFFTSRAGSEVPSLYLVKRDFYIPEWHVPVDAGYKTISYQFKLDPIYRYYLKAIAYHESAGEWREWFKIDKKMRRLIKYEAHQPETLGFWIPPGFYKDGVIDVDIEHIKGKFAAIGPIYIYRCEYEEEREEEIAYGGLESGTKNPTYGPTLKLTPNPFKDRISIDYIHPRKTKITASIYDISGRLVKRLHDGKLEGRLTLDWRGKTKNDDNVSAGIYFLRIDNLTSKEVLSRKVIKIR